MLKKVLFAVQPLEEGDRSKILCEFVTQVSIYNAM